MSKFFCPLQRADVSWVNNLPYSKQHEDVYYAKYPTTSQSEYVFIAGNNLTARWKELEPESIFTIGETGFGAGINFLSTMHFWLQIAPKSARLHYISCEKYPFNKTDIALILDQHIELNKYRDLLLEQYPILTPGHHHLSFANDRIKLTLMLGDCFDCYEQLLITGDSVIESCLRKRFVDAWYLDGFSPKKNSEMWSPKLIQILAMLSTNTTTIATYSASHVIKSALIENGFSIAKKKGYGTKRHMLIGTFSRIDYCRTKQRDTPWHSALNTNIKEKSAIVIGGGLAGSFIAYSLAQRGWKITLIDDRSQVGKGASANQQAVLFPKLSAFRSPLTEFMLSAFLYAQQFYKKHCEHSGIATFTGLINLPHNAKEQSAQCNLKEWLTEYPELGVLLDQKQASQLAGIPLNSPCLFIPDSGWINSPDLCSYLVTNPLITLVSDTTVDKLYNDGKEWHANNYHAPVLIVANGYKANQFGETAHLPLKPIRGQMSTIATTEITKQLKLPLCGEGHVLPAINGLHTFGATYDLGSSHEESCLQDDLDNSNKLNRLAPNVQWSSNILGHWSGVRASTPDYLPLVGPVAQSESFLSAYAGLQSNSKRWVDVTAPYHDNLYVFCGFGSRGITSIPIASEWLGALINNEICGAPRHLLKAIAPARFLRRRIIRGE